MSLDLRIAAAYDRDATPNFREISETWYRTERPLMPMIVPTTFDFPRRSSSKSPIASATAHGVRFVSGNRITKAQHLRFDESSVVGQACSLAGVAWKDRSSYRQCRLCARGFCDRIREGGAPERSRISDLRLWRPTLFPTALPRAPKDRVGSVPWRTHAWHALSGRCTPIRAGNGRWLSSPIWPACQELASPNAFAR